MKLPQPILILSDGTGETAEKVVRAALQQFQHHLVHVRTHAHITRQDQLTSWFRIAARQNAFVVTTLVRADMREFAELLSRETGVMHLDLIGNLHVANQLESRLDAWLPTSLNHAPHDPNERVLENAEWVNGLSTLGNKQRVYVLAPSFECFSSLPPLARSTEPTTAARR